MLGYIFVTNYIAEIHYGDTIVLIFTPFKVKYKR